MIDNTNYEANAQLFRKASENLQQNYDMQQKRTEDTRKADLERREASEKAWNSLVAKAYENLNK